MTPIQIIIIIVLILLAVAVARNVYAVITRVAIIVILLGGVSLALDPDLSTRVAGWLGVGRGADLLFYMAILLFFFLFLKLYSRMRKLEQKLTELIRQQAIREANNTEGEQD